MKKLLLSLALLPACLMLADSFVITKKTKKVSTSTLKEHCSECVVQTLQETPRILKEVAELQEVGMEIMTAVVENSFFAGATNESLKSDAKVYQTMVQELEEVTEILQKQKSFLRKQKEKYKA